ncbi:MAG: transglutaminase domain-containing protein [Candidatus Micrarchaeota archaeon]
MADRRHLIIFAFLLITLISIQHAKNISPFLVSSATYTISNEHTIRLSHGTATDLSLNLSIPLNSEIISSSTDYELQEDELGNLYIIMEENNPDMPYTFSSLLVVSTKQEVLDSFSEPSQFDSTLSKYVSSSVSVPSSSDEMRQLALNITSNSHTSFEKVSALAQYTYNLIEYDLSYAQKNMSVYNILDERRGVCEDYSLLFTTLSRSLGYPTRFVNGYAYSDVHEEWIGHSWVEVYIGKWVSVDPTWLEVGLLDATHIPMSKQIYSEFSTASVSALVYPPDATIYMEGIDGASMPASNLKVESIKSLPPSKEFKLGSSPQEIAPGADFLVYLEYPAKDYRLLKTVLTPCKADSDEIVFLDNEEQILTTFPGKEQYIIWTGKAGTAISENVIYTCPLTLNSEYLERRSIDIEISHTDNITEMDASIYCSSLAPGSMQKVFVQLPPSLAGNPVTILSQDFKTTKNSDEEGYAEFEFIAERTGSHKVYVWTTSGSPVTLKYSVDSGPGKLFDIEFKNINTAGEKGEIIVKFGADSIQNLPVDSVSWRWNGQSGRETLSPGQQEIAMPFTPLIDGNFFVFISLVDANGIELYSQSKALSVASKISSLPNTSISQKEEPPPSPGILLPQDEKSMITLIGQVLSVLIIVGLIEYIRRRIFSRRKPPSDTEEI